MHCPSVSPSYCFWKRSRESVNVTCIPTEFPNAQFESALLVPQPEVLVLGESGAVFVIPEVHLQDPRVRFAFGQGVNFAQTKPVIICGN